MLLLIQKLDNQWNHHSLDSIDGQSGKVPVDIEDKDGESTEV